jgi:Threonine synthase
VVEEYRERLPVSDATPVISLGEGGTPLVRSDPLSLETGCDVWLKYDGANPTGSFKDRGMTLAISKAVEGRAKAVGAPPPATRAPRPPHTRRGPG